MLNGRRILLVEDEPLIAMMAEDMLSDLGAEVVGPAHSLGAALELAEREGFDAAVLDINLQGETSDAVAEVLRRRGLPFLFATGYGPRRVGETEAPVLDKPYTERKLAQTLRALLGERAAD